MLTFDEKLRLIELEDERRRRKSRRQLFAYMPYPKQIEFHENGKVEDERLLMAGNQQGKTKSASAEVAMHLTGRYPEAGECFYPTETALRTILRIEPEDSPTAADARGWLENLGFLGLLGADIYPDGWPGRRFHHPISAWVGGQSSRDTRDIVQANLLGDPEDPTKLGTGMIPFEDIIPGGMTRIPGVPNAFDTAMIAHQSGGRSILGFKSFDQGRKRWQGTGKHVIWCDEEPPYDVYMEAKARTSARNGICLTTFTPLLGMSEVVRLFIHEERDLLEA